MQSKQSGSPLNLDTEFIPSCLRYIVFYEDDNDLVPKVVSYNDHDISFESFAINIRQNNSKIDASKSQIQSSLLPERSENKKVENMRQIQGEKVDMRSSLEAYRVNNKKKYLNGCEFILESSNRVSKQSKQKISREVFTFEKHEICLVMPSKEQFIHITLQINSKINIFNQIVQAINSSIQNYQKLSKKDIILMDMQTQLDESPNLVSFRYIPKNEVQDIESKLLSNEGLSFFYVFIPSNRFSNSLSVQEPYLRLLSPNKPVGSLPQDKRVEVKIKLRILKVILQDGRSFLLDFDKIMYIQIRFLLSILKAKQPSRKGLKIFDQIYQPSKTLFQFSSFFQKCDYALNLTAFVIDESFFFQKEIQTVRELSKEDFNIISSLFVKNPNKPILSLPALTTLKVFMSQEQIHNCRKGRLQYIHHQINKHITIYYRETYTVYEQWKTYFIHSLCTQIQAKPAYLGKVYRRIYYQLDRKEGDILEFKGFIVAAIQQKYLKDPIKGSTLFIIHSTTGRRVGGQTSFIKDNEVIFQPYSRFKIISIKQSQAKETYIELVEQLIEQPSKKSSVVLWVDDKLKEGKALFSYFMKQNASILMYQFVSTAQLNSWIQQNPQYRNTNQNIQFVVISNMARTEGEQMIKDAGVDTLEVAKAKIPNLKFIFYIGYIDGTKNALKNRNISPDIVEIIDDTSRLIKALDRIFKSHHEEKKENMSVIYTPEKEKWNDVFSQLK